MYVCEIYIRNSSLFVNKLFSYASKEFIEPFKRVAVNFAKGESSGIVINCFKIDDITEYEREKGYKLLYIKDVLDDFPIIDNSQYELAKWLSKTTISPFISCLNTMLPKALQTSRKYIEPIKEDRVYKNPINIKLTDKQQAFYNKLTDGMLAKDARKLSIHIFNKLLELNLIYLDKKEKEYKNEGLFINDNFKELTLDQQTVYNSFINSDKQVSLLFGVTGSGKTEVYLHLARKYLEEDKEVLILVPEISLTPQMISRVKERFNDVIFYHSELSDQERYLQYKRVKQGEVKIVVGTRSSIFLPFNNLGLIIVDEEHDTSYKQDNTPCYNLKNVALKRAFDFNSKVLLASATPSLDSYTRALKGDYNLLKLENRINNNLPDIDIVDLTKIKKGESYIISNKLKDEITNCLKNNNQVIILLNRRGYSPIVKCGDCGSTLMCSDCDVPLNYHKDTNTLKCHVCGKQYKNIHSCPKCHSDNLIYYGFGTLKVEEELRRIFEGVNIERMDRDSTSKKGSHEAILKRFENKEIDILIGTQMISKGLDFPNVTLVGILNADAGLAHQDYNAAKLTFDLLMQASGRSGRANKRGKVIIQAFNPDHYVLKAVLKQDYQYFYNIEMHYRYNTSYPPYYHLVEILLYDNNVEYLNNALKYFNDKFNNLSYKHYRPFPLGKIKGNERYRLLMVDKSLKNMLDDLWNIIDEYLNLKHMAKIKIDIDPLYLE